MSVPVTVRLAVAPAFPGIAADGLIESLRSAAADVVAALELPVEPRVEPGTPLPQDGAGPPYTVQVAGEPARTPWNALPPANEAALVARLRYDLARNAELFVTAAVAEAVRSTWSGTPAAGLSRDDAARVLRECVRLGCRVGRLSRAETGGADRDPPGWRPLESALEEAAALRITVPGGFLPEDAATAAASLKERVHGSTGVILPTVEIREAADDVDHPLRVEVLDVAWARPLAEFDGDAIDQLVAAIEPWLPSFVVRETTIFRVVAARRAVPRLVDAVRGRFSDGFITRTCRALVAEGIGITDFRAILGGLHEIREPTTADEKRRIVFHSPAGTAPPALALSDGRLDPEDAADCVRLWARRRVTTRHWEAGNLRARLLDPGLEDMFRAGGVRPGSETQHRFLERLGDSADPILTNVDVRRRVYEAIAFERPDVAVLCYQELLPETNITPVERVSL